MRVDAFATEDAAPGLLDELHALCVRAFDGDFDPDDDAMITARCRWSGLV